MAQSGADRGPQGRVLTRLVWAAAFAAALVAGAVAGAESPLPVVTGPRVVGIGFTGPITAGDVERLRNAIALAGDESFPARIIVFFDSGGGDGLAAMQIGRMLRHARAHVFVTKRCASACVFAYAGGVYRSALPETLGIHRARLTTTRDGKTVDIDIDKSPAASQFFMDAEAQIAHHIEEMGLSRDLIDAMQAVAPQSMRWLTADEAKGFGLVGFAPAYLQERARMLRSRYSIPEHELPARSATVLERCAESVDQHPAFIACYRKQLLARP